MRRVGFIGVPGAGKTSTARGVAAACRRIPGLKNIELIAEYARRHINKHGPVQHLWEQYRILQKQVEWEDSIPQDVDMIITDSPIHMSFAYACECFKNGDPKEVMLMNDIFKMMTKLNHPARYEIVFYLKPHVVPVDDGTRPKSNFDHTWRFNMNASIHNTFTTVFKPKKLITLSDTSLDKRIDECLACLEDNKDL